MSRLFFLSILSLVFLPVSAHAAERTLVHNGIERSYIIDKPVLRGKVRKIPAIIVLHGGGGNGEMARNMTHFSRKAVPSGVMAVYPSGTGPLKRADSIRTWNAEHCCGYAMKNDVDDIGFISALIDSLVANDNADPKRIYVTGMSNGAMMTHRLGAALPHKIAAIAPVVGGLFGGEPKPSSPVSALMINGKLDETVLLNGGNGGGRFSRSWDGVPLKPASYQSAFWGDVNGCNSEVRTAQQKGGLVTRESYECPAGREVVRYVVNDNGHAWPGGEQGSKRGDAPSSALNATDVIFDFFMRQSK